MFRGVSGFLVLFVLLTAVPTVCHAETEPPAQLLAEAMAGARDAQFELGEFYYRDKSRRDLDKARGWYSKAAEAGHPKAQAIMGYFLINGVGVEKDIDAGVEWYKKAVAQGQHMAEYNLGLMYEKGQGGHKDVARAVELFKEAARDPR